jgi:AcrR family transcriptional regulator
MVANRGYDSVDAKSRLRLIDAAAELLSDEGHPAFSARRIADHAQLKPQLVHYYFRSMEDLVVAVFQRATAEYFALHDRAMSSAAPVRAIWELNSHLPVARLMTEFVALGKRYPMLREVMRVSGERFRQLQIEAIERRYAERALDEGLPPPAALAMMLSAIARNLVIEGNVGMSSAHRELLDYVGGLLDRIDPV